MRKLLLETIATAALLAASPVHAANSVSIPLPDDMANYAIASLICNYRDNTDIFVAIERARKMNEPGDMAAAIQNVKSQAKAKGWTGGCELSTKGRYRPE
jgi:hypothetical protein